jgi:hypothetical protein
VLDSLTEIILGQHQLVEAKFSRLFGWELRCLGVDGNWLPTASMHVVCAGALPAYDTADPWMGLVAVDHGGRQHSVYLVSLGAVWNLTDVSINVTCRVVQ